MSQRQESKKRIVAILRVAFSGPPTPFKSIPKRNGEPRHVGKREPKASASKPVQTDDQYSPEETARRRDEVLKRMLNTPPKPHATHPPQSRKTTAGGRLVQKSAAHKKS